MSSASSFQLTTDTFSPPIIDTFSPRVAPRPRVIPVYATSIPRRLKRSLSIHQTLRVKPIFHPYSRRSDRPPPIGIGIGIAPPSPQDSSVESYKGATPPGSPLSELDDSINSLPGVRTILTPPPKSKLTVNAVGWSDALKASYRKTAREAVDLYLNVQHNLAQQNADVLDKARTHIEHELPALRNHQDHWGADILLREQLKNKKDTLAKADKRGAGSEKQEGESSRASGKKGLK
ncbi:hypothetical protein BT96DRAFT_1105052 [Gymnopus androsaceus JB14]|uniref:Uncharacterized protein n=1 Tax=Gymnopus androsaceus JB14 TaxID=1447944 RepID=A0A6A4GED0_9AGAR|nr:hypothetical protein BT96DRAFT_1105052 [Gymnopus androsaceus JB14]